MQVASTIQIGEVIAAVTVFGLMVSVPLILVFAFYKFSKRSGK
ncbi:hypothetical protein [Planococcus chinensis]|uniref:Uncharacterized protein n=1 Tax=Planococcus chinensis TaxID=272917 RepID=A0ABW4QLH8_9BACL